MKHGDLNSLSDFFGRCEGLQVEINEWLEHGSREKNIEKTRMITITGLRCSPDILGFFCLSCSTDCETMPYCCISNVF